MLLIGVLNLGIGFCAYKPAPPEPERITLTLPPPTPAARPTDRIDRPRVDPRQVMRAFAVKYPRHVPSRAKKLVAADGSATFESLVHRTGDHRRLSRDGTFVSEAP